MDTLCLDNVCDVGEKKHYENGWMRGGWLIGLAVLFLIIAIIWYLIDVFRCNEDGFDRERFHISSGPAAFFFLAVVFVLFAIYYKLR